MSTNLLAASPKTVGQWLENAGRRLQKAGVDSARLDGLILLEDNLKKDRAYLLAHPEISLPKAILPVLNQQLRRRLNHEPLAYIRGKAEFYGRKFKITPRVLQPRPETETMIELLKQLKLPANALIVDIGTGSGNLAITAKLELPFISVIATDIDSQALAQARQNAHKYAADIKFLQANLLEPLFALRPSPFALLANLPYVPDKFKLNRAATHEPKLAIFGGKDGLAVYRRLFKQLANFAGRPKYLLTESMSFQHPQMIKLAKAAGYKLEKTLDFIQLFTYQG